MQSETQQVLSRAAPPEFLQLAAHPLRWQLLAELARSDRKVRELMGSIGEPQNLVSYHLGKLRDAGLVSVRRSSADRRDAYYAVDLARVADLMCATGAALHPGLHLTAPSPPTGSNETETAPKKAGGARNARDKSHDKRKKPTRVLFLCTGNSARSQMAEALLRERSGSAIDVFSAGSRPKPLHLNAVRVMQDEYGIDITGYASKRMDTFTDQRFDYVISLCDRVREICPEFPHQPATAHWSILDPAAGQADDDSSYPSFRETAAELDTRIAFLLAAINNRNTAQ